MRLAAMFLDLVLSEPLTEEEVPAAEDPSCWPPSVSDGFPLTNLGSGTTAGVTRILNAKVSDDRTMVRLEFDLSDVAQPGDDELVVPE